MNSFKTQNKHEETSFWEGMWCCVGAWRKMWPLQCWYVSILHRERGPSSASLC